MRIVLALVLAAALAPAHANHAVSAGVTQHVGAKLPLDAPVTDALGRVAPLGRYFGDVPVIVAFGYYRCPTLCTTLMESVLVAASATGLQSDAYRIVEIGIDPRESARDAAARARGYRKAYSGLPFELLTANEAAIRSIASAAGVDYVYDERYGQYSHPLALLVAAPDGTISRYLPGIVHDAQDLRLALVEAADRRIGSFADRVFLRCAHYDEAAGRYTFAAMSAVRAVALALALALGAWLWSRRRGG